MNRLIFLSLLAAGCNGSGSSGFGGTLLAITSTSAEVGKQGKLRVTFDNPLAGDTNVMLTSSTPSVATVGDHITVPEGAVSAELAWTAVALGSTIFYATAGSSTQVANANVVDHFTVQSIDTNDDVLEKGATTLMFVQLNGSTPAPIMIDTSAADATVAGIPATVAISPWSTFTRTTLSALTVGNTAISAHLGDDTVSNQVTVVDHARLQRGNSLASQTVEVGGVITGNVVVDAVVAAPTTIGATSSDATVAAAPANVVIPAGTRTTQVRIPVVGAGQTTIGFTLADSSFDASVTGVSSVHLLSINVSTPTQVGAQASGTVTLDAVAGTPHAVALTSSDPTIVAVPPQVTVAPGSISANFNLTPLKSGTATITASLGGASLPALVYVADASGASLSLSWFGNKRLLPGANPQFGIFSTASMVQLSASTPGILSFPQQVNIPSYGAVYLTATALKAGTTTLTATNGTLSSSVSIEVVATPDLELGPTFTVAPGQSASGTVFFNAQAPTGTYVTFTSSNPSVLATPPAVTLGDTSDTVSFQLMGMASGTAILTATTMGVSRTAVVYVGVTSPEPAFLQSISLGFPQLEVGAATYVQLQFTNTSPTDQPITLQVSPAPIASLTDSSAVLAAGENLMFLPIVAKAPGTAEVRATAGGVTRTTSISVVAEPTFSISVAGSVQVGGAIEGSINVDCLLASDRSVALMSDMPSVAAITPPAVTLSPGSTSAQFEVRGLSMGAASISYAPSPLPSPSPPPVTVNVF
jgi:hypothetical protein